VSEQPMLDDITRQPSLLRGLASRLGDIEAFWREHLRDASRLIAFGSGDGWFAARSVSARAGEPGLLPASGLEIAGDQGPLIAPSDRLIAISMSGNVDRTVEAAARAIGHGAKAVSLTNSAGGRLAELGLANFSLQIDDVAPFLCGTSSFTATRTVLAAFSALADGQYARAVQEQISVTADALENLLAEVAPIAEEIATQKAKATPGLRYLSCGRRGSAIADYGAAKIVELSATPVWSDDLEEFAHRQYWTMARGEVAVMLPTSAFVADIAKESAGALRAMEVDTVAIGPVNLGVETARWQMAWRDEPKADDATLASGALQLLAYHWAEAAGFDPNRRMHLKNDTTRFKTSRLLTRRSLHAVAGDPATAV
jgi:glucosamine 6-phosphate synthetase-like amidotransferase/phosphosugar isomerase protein